MSIEPSLPFSQASENNKLPVLEVFKQYLTSKKSLLEIGGGTGQHAVFFAEQFPELRWQSTDIPFHVNSLNLRLSHAQLANLPLAFSLDVNQPDWGCDTFDAIFTANSLHIMSEDSVQNFFAGVGRHLQDDDLLLVYGPFKYGGEFTTESNARFDLWLKDRDPVSGVRDFEWVNALTEKAGLEFVEDNAMPANNQLIVWRHIG